MRALYFTLLLLFLGGCEQSKLTQLKENLSGTWEVYDNNGNLFFREKWYTQDEKFLGEGQRFKNDELVFTEHIELKKMGKELFYVVEDVNPDPTSFKVLSYSSQEFLAENENNSFPKYIHYIIAPDSIHAIVYGNGDTLRFNMRRVN